MDDLKRCNRCESDRPLASFYKDASTKDHLARSCKHCMKAAGAKWYAQNKVRVLTAGSARYAENKEAILAGAKVRYAANKVEKLEQSRAWAKANPERMRGYARKSHHKNRAARNVASALWRAQNRDRHLELVSRWAASNKAAGAASTAARRAAKKASVATWADSEFESFAISEAYDLRQLRGVLTGVEHEVDHIVPLKGRTVCGLHCIANLQVIPMTLNASKGNRHWPDMP